MSFADELRDNSLETQEKISVDHELAYWCGRLTGAIKAGCRQETGAEILRCCDGTLLGIGIEADFIPFRTIIIGDQTFFFQPFPKTATSFTVIILTWYIMMYIKSIPDNI